MERVLHHSCFFWYFFELTCAGFIQIIHRRLFHQCGRFQKVNISSYYNPGQNILELKTEGLSKLGNIKKNLKSVWRQTSVRSYFQKRNFDKSSQKTRKIGYQTFLFFPSSANFFYFVSNILFEMSQQTNFWL